MQTPQPTTHSFSPQQEAILTSLSRGANRASACHAAGLPRRTFYNWIKSDAAFSEAVEEAEAESIGVAEDLAYACAMKAIEDPRYLRALFFWLKHRAGWIQARPEPTPAVGARHAVPSSSPTPSFAAPTSPPAPAPQPTSPPAPAPSGPVALRSQPAVLPDPISASGDDTSAENPAPGVPFVPLGEEPGAREVNGRSTPVACPPPALVSTENLGIRVPFVPSENPQPETSAATHEVNRQHPTSIPKARPDAPAAVQKEKTPVILSSFVTCHSYFECAICAIPEPST